MEWTFITTHFRKHGIAFFEMVLKAMALKTEDICYDHLRKLKKTGFQQIDLVKESVVLKGFNAIYLKPIWVEKESKVFPNPAKNIENLKKSLELEHGQNAPRMIKKFEELLSSEKEIIKEDLVKKAEKIFQEKEMHSLWQIIHELPADQQFEWFEKYSHFKKDIVSGTWDKLKAEEKKIKIVKFDDSLTKGKNDEISWIRNLDHFVDQLQNDMKIGINIFDTSTLDNLSWRYLQPRKIKLKNAVFFEVKTEKKDEDDIRFRDLFFKNTFQNLLVDTDATPHKKEEDWWHKNRKDAKKQLMKFKELGDLFSIVVFGERGCGKSKMIRDVFDKDMDEDGIQTVNCAAIPEALAESNLFGHVKGAFTGADRDEPGVFGKLKAYQGETKGHGVLFLDEFNHLSKAIQSKLLVALQTDEGGNFSFMKLGGNKREKVKFQLILGTNKTEDVLREESIIYQDFLDRVMQRKVFIPSFQPEEIIPAWQAIWKKMGFINSVTDPLNTEMKNEFEKWLKSLEYPGNFRDIERLCILVADGIRLNESEVINEEIFIKIKDTVRKHWPTFLDKEIKKEESEKEISSIIGSDGLTNPKEAEKRAKLLIAEKILSHHGGNIDKSVKNCKGFSRSTMLRWLQKDNR